MAGHVIFYVDGRRRATRTLHSGAATYSARLPRGRHHVHVRFVGTSAYRAASSPTLVQREH